MPECEPHHAILHGSSNATRSAPHPDSRSRAAIGSRPFHLMGVTSHHRVPEPPGSRPQPVRSQKRASPARSTDPLPTSNHLPPARPGSWSPMPTHASDPTRTTTSTSAIARPTAHDTVGVFHCHRSTTAWNPGKVSTVSPDARDARRRGQFGHRSAGLDGPRGPAGPRASTEARES